MDSTEFTITAVQSMQAACEEIFLKNKTFWKPSQGKNGTIEPPTDLRMQMCPGLCSGNGVCTNSTCKCNEPFTADDCSVNKNIPPVIESVGIDGMCDIQKHSNCHIVKIEGRNFLENERLTCFTSKINVCYLLHCL